MPKISGTYVTYDIVGQREDLSEIISNIDPTETPFISSVGARPRAENTYFEWQLDSLAAVNTANAQPEGNDATFVEPTATTRVGAHVQISNKTLIVSGSAEATRKAGRKSEMGYQIAKDAKALKRDIEGICLQRNTGDSGTDPRQTPSMLAYVRSNTIKGVGGADPAAPSPAYAGNRTDGTQVAFTQSMLTSVLSSAYTNGMKVGGSTILLGPAQKGVFSGFANKATPMIQVNSKQTSILAAADIFISDFGNLTVVPDRFQRNRDAWILDFELIGLKDLRPYEVIDLAKTGDANKKLLQREWGLQVDNEKGLALVADLV